MALEIFLRPHCLAAPGSLHHKSGNPYTIECDKPIATPSREFVDLLLELIEEEEKRKSRSQESREPAKSQLMLKADRRIDELIEQLEFEVRTSKFGSKDKSGK